MKPESSFSSPEVAQQKYVSMSKILTIGIMIVSLYATTQIQTISGVWSFIIECGAGLGLVLILRWYWWRINAWSEITATIAPFIAYAFSKFILGWEFPNSFFLTVGFTTTSWILVTYLTKPTEEAKLIFFYKKVRPDGFWQPIKTISGIETGKSKILNLVVCWLSAVLMTYSILFFTGKIIFHEWDSAIKWFISALISFFILRMFIKRTKIFED